MRGVDACVNHSVSKVLQLDASKLFVLIRLVFEAFDGLFMRCVDAWVNHPVTTALHGEELKENRDTLSRHPTFFRLLYY